ncbi:hypothetical protein, partial [Salmonella enterica]|uniref:hypothetical protein n=1 Tax=Salmonella enterica TaxID=28901 RepID=UPI001E625D63
MTEAGTVKKLNPPPLFFANTHCFQILATGYKKNPPPLAKNQTTTQRQTAFLNNPPPSRREKTTINFRRRLKYLPLLP